MKKIVIPIKGMHCRSCEMLIEERVSKIPEVNKIIVNYKKAIAEVYYDTQKPNEQEIEEAIREAGYAIGSNGKKYLLSSNVEDYKDLGIALLFLVGIYLILKSFGILNFNFAASASNPSSLSVVLLVGLTAGVSSCMALVGGLILGISARHAEKHPEATPLQKFKPHLFFNLGRIVAYVFFGSILGAVGSVFQLSSLMLGVLTIAVGAVMLVMGLQLIEIFPVVSGIKFTLPKFVSRALGVKNHHEKEYSHSNSALMGGLTFFLPCGFTQAMQLFAISTGSMWAGGLVMGTFALGTAPGLLGIGGITSIVKGIFAKRFFKFAGVLVIFFSIFNIANGYNLTGWQLGSGASSNSVQSADENVTMENGVQIVRMTEIASGYVPNSFTVKKGVPVKWIIDAQDPFSCASSLVMPKENISKRLVKGENIIEFTPKETGALKFSCSMGMYTGVFNVVDELGNGSKTSQASTTASSAGGSCGMMSGGGGGCGGCGGGAQIKKDTTETSAKVEGNVQVINAIYTAGNYLQPNSFKVKSGTKVKLTIDVKDSGRGCGYAIMISGLYNNAVPLQAGQPIVMEFTPTTRGSFNITCGMGMINYGTIIVE
ncbi:MAG: sulfite exporter TauE/SafE family protein [Parcubacteria group bacterium]|jgi:sulfite exporter TauE/SafE/copper chaperone CopZ